MGNPNTHDGKASWLPDSFFLALMITRTCPVITQVYRGAHLWDRFYTAFEGEDVAAHKTLAHATMADVFGERTTLWEKKGKFYKPNNFDYLNRPRSQDSSFLKENGAILITKPKILIKNKNRLGGNISIFEMDKKKSIDVDTIYDFKLAEIIMKKLN